MTSSILKENKSNVNIILIGVSGCSASGKTSVANKLAIMLNSPIFPIGMDHFFNIEICKTLGTWEDPRGIRYNDFVQFIFEVREQLGNYFNSFNNNNNSNMESLKYMSKEVKELLRCAPHHLLSSSNTTIIQNEENKEKNENETKIIKSEISHDSFSDDSLIAHEEEDAQQRVHSNTDINNQNNSNTKTIFIICEGFLLFTNAKVTKLFDYFIFVDIDEETACLRRFFRAPRRHWKINDNYINRIERLIESRRELLPKYALKELRSNNNKNNSEEDEMNSSLFTSVLLSLEYIPPSPSVVNNYEKFWMEKEYKQHPPPPPPIVNIKEEKEMNSDNSNILSYQWMEVKDISYIKHELQSRFNNNNNNTLLFSNSSSTNNIDEVTPLEQYFGFRYWFYFEVLYYFHLFYFITEKNVAMASSKKNNSINKESISCIWRFFNGAKVSEEMLEEKLYSFANNLIKHYENSK